MLKPEVETLKNPLDVFVRHIGSDDFMLVAKDISPLNFVNVLFVILLIQSNHFI